MASEFHEQTLRLLPLRPTLSERNAQILIEREQALGIRFPASIREWYSLDRSVEMLHEYSNQDRPVPLEELGAPVDRWYGTGPRDFLAQSLLLIMTENQGVSHWAVRLDGSEDPPVVVEVDSAPNEVWQPLARNFSEFIYCQVWDFMRSQTSCGAQEVGLSVTELHYLQSTFAPGPVTHGWPGSSNYRFTTPTGRILIWHSPQEHGADWQLFADDADQLHLLLKAVWNCGQLAQTLYGHNRTAEETLFALRRQTISHKP